MTRFLLLSTLLLSAPAAAAERGYTVTDFDRVQVEGPFEVVLTTGKSPRAVATGSAQALDRVAIDVQGRTLRVRANRSAWGGFPNSGAGPVRIALSTHNLRAAAVGGAGRLTIDRANAMRFDAALSGSGQLGIGRLEADTLSVALIGSGKITLGGKAKQLSATVQGSGELDAGALEAKDARISTDSAGNIAARITGSANVTSKGLGDVTIAGEPACTVNATGAGRVTC